MVAVVEGDKEEQEVIRGVLHLACGGIVLESHVTGDLAMEGQVLWVEAEDEVEEVQEEIAMVPTASRARSSSRTRTSEVVKEDREAAREQTLVKMERPSDMWIVRMESSHETTSS